MDNVRSEVLSAIVRLGVGKEFRQTDIKVEASRQLINYHLKQLAKDGLIEKTGLVYTIKSNEGLVDAFLNAHTKSNLRKMIPAGFVAESSSRELNNTADLLVAMKFLGIHQQQQANAFYERLDHVTQEFNELKRYLRFKVFSSTQAAKVVLSLLEGENGYKTFKTIGTRVGEDWDLDQFRSLLKVANDLLESRQSVE